MVRLFLVLFCIVVLQTSAAVSRSWQSRISDWLGPENKSQKHQKRRIPEFVIIGAQILFFVPSFL